MDQIFVGTELKFAVHLTAEGFDMDRDYFLLEITRGSKVIKSYEKSDLVIDEDGTYLMCVDSKEIGVGSFDILITAEIPDGHFPDGYRTEIHKQSLITVKKI